MFSIKTMDKYKKINCFFFNKMSLTKWKEEKLRRFNLQSIEISCHIIKDLI